MTITIDPKNIFTSEAVTDPAELADLPSERTTDAVQDVCFLGVFESDAITDPLELAKFHREPTSDQSPPILSHEVDEFIASEGDAITDPALIARLRVQVDPARKVR